MRVFANLAEMLGLGPSAVAARTALVVGEEQAGEVLGQVFERWALGSSTTTPDRGF